MESNAQGRGVSLARVALAYVLAKLFVTSVITGAKTVEQLDDNLAASGPRLSAEEMAALDAVNGLPPGYPGWMSERQSGGPTGRMAVVERDA